MSSIIVAGVSITAIWEIAGLFIDKLLVPINSSVLSSSKVTEPEIV